MESESEEEKWKSARNDNVCVCEEGALCWTGCIRVTRNGCGWMEY